jgi:hypothetical protein
VKISDLSVVVQGAVDSSVTSRCLQSVREHLPQARIILSTWDNSDIKGLDYDELVLNPLPEHLWNVYLPNNPFGYSKQNSMNNQIISSYAGLKKVSTQYAMKFRTDFILTSNSMISAYNELSKAMPKSDPKWRVFEKKILTMSTGNPRIMSLAYHLGDFVQLGLAKDVLRLWSIPPLTQEDAQWCQVRGITHAPHFFAYRYCCEQKIVLDNLDREKKLYHKPYHYFDCYDEIIHDSEMFFLHNFLILDYPNSGVDSKFVWLIDPRNTFEYRPNFFMNLYEFIYGSSNSIKLLRKKYDVRKRFFRCSCLTLITFKYFFYYEHQRSSFLHFRRIYLKICGAISLLCFIQNKSKTEIRILGIRIWIRRRKN